MLIIPSPWQGYDDTLSATSDALELVGSAPLIREQRAESTTSTEMAPGAGENTTPGGGDSKTTANSTKTGT